MTERTVTVVRCPRCGSIQAGGLDPLRLERARLRCGDCGHASRCDAEKPASVWTEHLPDGARELALGHVLPDVRFLGAWAALGGQGGARPALLALRAGYAEPQRAYHTGRHVGACLRLLDEPDVAALAERAVEVEAALWFHDAVYDPRASDNEEQSAALAERVLGEGGVPSDAIARIAAHVRATKDHEARSPDAQLVVDVDLSILGASEGEFARFEDEIRCEYAWVEPAAYAFGRAAVLGRFLARPKLYGTTQLAARFEARARANLAAALARLAGGPSRVPRP